MAGMVLGQRFHAPGEFEVELADTVGVVCTQVDDEAVVHIEPLGMMLHGLGDEGHLRHEAEALDEARKAILLVQLAVEQLPAAERGEPTGDLRVRKWCWHAREHTTRSGHSSKASRSSRVIAVAPAVPASAFSASARFFSCSSRMPSSTVFLATRRYTFTGRSCPIRCA